MFGWESLPWLVELDVLSQRMDAGGTLTKEQESEAYKTAYKRVFESLMNGRVKADMAMANLHEHDRRSASMSGAMKFGAVAFFAAFIVCLIANLW